MRGRQGPRVSQLQPSCAWTSGRGPWGRAAPLWEGLLGTESSGLGLVCSCAVECGQQDSADRLPFSRKGDRGQQLRTWSGQLHRRLRLMWAGKALSPASCLSPQQPAELPWGRGRGGTGHHAWPSHSGSATLAPLHPCSCGCHSVPPCSVWADSSPLRALREPFLAGALIMPPQGSACTAVKHSRAR